jgi:type II secretory pathway pseudopilin PulG
MPSNPRQRGYILVATLFMTFVVGVMLLALTRWWQIESQREKERELLWIGAQFRAALAGYAASTPSGGPIRPSELADLVRDERTVPPGRHLRHVYVDPMTASTAWGIVRAPDGTITALHSRSDGKPLAPDGSSPRFRAFEHAKRYSEWRFGAGL